jgi:hypothetical protein
MGNTGVALPEQTATNKSGRHELSTSQVSYPEWMGWALFGLMLAAVFIRLFYWYYTDRTWEDALITVLHSENFVRGLGLTHLQPPGEPPLHGFTSPLSVLIPLVGDLVHVGWGLPFLKLVSALCAPIAVWLGARISQVLGLPPALVLTVAAFLAFEHHQILWSMAGMETEVVIVAYLASIYAMQRGTQWQKGLSLGFVMLARPDGAIWVAIAFAVELWRAKKRGTWRDLWPVAAGLVLVYGPWIVFTFLYYSSPVPNTIRAKLDYPSVRSLFDQVSGFHKLGLLVSRVSAVLGSLGPSYAGNGTSFRPLWDHRIIEMIVVLFGVIGAALAIVRRHLDALILFSFVIAYTIYLVAAAPIVFGWYTPPIAAAAIVGSCYGLNFVVSRFKPVHPGRVFAVAGAVYILTIVSILPLTFRSDKYIQKDIETGVRKQLGVYLGRVSLPTDTISSESLGYVGYYSHRVIYDYPGLCNRDVVQYFRQHPHHAENQYLPDMVEAMRPTYAVFRPMEYRDSQGNNRYPWLVQRYDLIRVFKAPDDAGKRILLYSNNKDYEFDVFRLKGAPAAAQEASPQ